MSRHLMATAASPSVLAGGCVKDLRLGVDGAVADLRRPPAGEPSPASSPAR